MKSIFLLPIIFLFFGCATYTDTKFFDCAKTENYKKDSDKKELIYKVLKRAVVDEKDIPDYNLIKDKKKIYIENNYAASILDEEEMKILPLTSSEIPSEIKGISFCLKSKPELQAIADKTSPFLYLTFKEIKIDGDIAIIGISNSWQPITKSKVAYLSGGGYVLQFKKVNGVWEFDKVLKSWMS